jgi:hypothetical protein
MKSRRPRRRSAGEPSRGSESPELCTSSRCSLFPSGRFDDQVDATAPFLDRCKMSAHEDRTYAYYRMRAEALRQRHGQPAALRRGGETAPDRNPTRDGV